MNIFLHGCYLEGLFGTFENFAVSYFCLGFLYPPSFWDWEIYFVEILDIYL